MMTFSAVSQAIERIAGAICLLTVAVSAAFFAYDSHKTQLEIRSAIANFGAVEQSAKDSVDSVNDSLRAVNRPCGSGGPCGLLAEAGKTMVKIGDVSVTTQRQVQQSATLVNSASSAIQSAAGDIHTVASRASELTAQATTDLQTANETIAAGQPLLASLARTSDAFTLTIQHADQLIQSPEIPETLGNVRATTKEFALISNDLRAWSHPVLNPDPCLTARCRWGRVIGKVGGYLSIGAQAETFGTFWKPLPVKVTR